jgi:hypothetical protein
VSDVYKRNPQGWREITNSPEIHAALAEVAEKAKAFAEGLAQDFRETGEYADSFVVVPTTVLWRRGPRAAVRLENTSDHAAAVEWGKNGDQHPHRTLGRTLDALKSL